MKDAPSWLSKNVRVKREEGCRLRLIFRAGNRKEQVTIINAFLRAERAVEKEYIESHKEDLRRCENLISKLESINPSDTVRNEIHDPRTYRIPLYRTEIARLKQTKVIK
jgi:hypothetical protein